MQTRNMFVSLTLAGVVAFAAAFLGCGEDEYRTEPAVQPQRDLGREPADVGMGREPTPPAGRTTTPAALPTERERETYMTDVRQRLTMLEQRAESLGQSAQETGQQTAQEVEQQVQALREEIDQLEMDERWQESRRTIDARLDALERRLEEQT
jgi:hypothetical protein